MPASLSVAWAPSSHTTATLYQLQYRLLGAKIWINATATPQPSCSALISGLTSNAVYEFRHIATSQPPWTEISLPTQIRVGVSPNAPTVVRVT